MDNIQGMSDRRSFDRRSRSRSFFHVLDRDRRSPFGQKIAIAKFNDRDRKNAISILLAFFQQSTFCRKRIFFRLIG